MGHSKRAGNLIDFVGRLNSGSLADTRVTESIAFVDAEKCDNSLSVRL